MTLAAPSSPETLPEAARVFARHWSPRILGAAVVLTLAARVWAARWEAWDLVILAAITASWPLLEWMIHVFILHYRPVVLWGRTIDFHVPRSHRAHHRDPARLDLLFIPTHVFLYAIPLQFALWFALMPSVPLALTGVCFYFTMALRYEWVHFLVHTRYRPRSGHYRRLWQNHRLHHFKNEHFWFGVSMLGGDRLLGTAPPFATVETSPTCRSLGLEATLGAETG
jgi:hypothetical protein